MKGNENKLTEISIILAISSLSHKKAKSRHLRETPGLVDSGLYSIDKYTAYEIETKGNGEELTEIWFMSIINPSPPQIENLCYACKANGRYPTGSVMST